MCGIAGEIRLDGRPAEAGRLEAMAKTLAHRGPEGEGIWHEGRAGLAHRRLALVDLSPTGAQPMQSADGRYVMTFNGEIYNYRELREELLAQGATFRSTSDTEILLCLFAKEGKAMLARLRGMFAFAIWDRETETLFFARDRIGKKPFFYAMDDRAFRFASELKALAIDGYPKPDWNAIRLFFGLQYIPSPLTGFVGWVGLPPASYGVLQDGTLSVSTYDAFFREPVWSGSEEEAAGTVRTQLEEAVRLRMIADVPVGAFLSGGVDSAAVVSLMARVSSAPVQTFTMGFPALGSDERKEARFLAERLGTDHHEFEAKAEHAVQMVDRLVVLYDAPYADSSALPTWLLARETKTFVKAVMTGDGGDELFAGYRRYGALVRAERMRRLGLGSIVSSLGRVAGSVLHDPRYVRFGRTIKALNRSSAAGYASLFVGSYFSAEEEQELLQPDFLAMTGGGSSEKFVEDHFSSSLGPLAGALDFDLHSYLPDDLNVKMDRATMAHGLEARSPFLDQELVRFVSRLPTKFLFKTGQTKPLLKAALKDVVPSEVFDRKKRGFQVPLAEWFRGELRSVFQERCLAESSPLLQICRRDVVEHYLSRNARGEDHGNRLWLLLSLATWLGRHAA